MLLGKVKDQHPLRASSVPFTTLKAQHYWRGYFESKALQHKKHHFTVAEVEPQQTSQGEKCEALKICFKLHCKNIKVTKLDKNHKK